MLLESHVERTVVARALTELGVFSVKVRGVERGWPDRQFILNDERVLWIEFKRPGERPTPYQLLVHKRLRHAGHKVEVHDNVEKALQAIRQAMDPR